MAAMDFPNSPTVGDLFGSTGTVWRWDGARWVSTSGPSGARGVVASSRKLAVQSGITTIVDISDLSVTVDLIVGRRYCVELINTSAYSTVANDIMGILIYAGGVHVGQANFKLHAAGEVQGIPTIKAYITAVGGSTIIKAQALRQVGTGSLSVYSATGWVPEIVVTDVTYEAGAAGPGGSPVIIENAQYTPTIVSGLVLGTGGTNTAEYTFIGPTGIGAVGSLAVTHNVVLGTSGFSVTGPPIFELPPGFSHAGVVSSAQLRYGLATIGSSIGAVQWNTGAAFAYVVLNASTTYAGATSISSTIPLTWGASDTIRSSFVIPQVVRI